jgi:hypothetical protein
MVTEDGDHTESVNGTVLLKNYAAFIVDVTQLMALEARVEAAKA